jgi:hypothetical protein
VQLSLLLHLLLAGDKMERTSVDFTVYVEIIVVENMDFELAWRRNDLGFQCLLEL